MCLPMASRKLAAEPEGMEPMTPIKLRRSALFVPGANPRALAKARALTPDVVIIDLEDGVSAADKDVARQQAAEALQEGGFKAREVVVRVNHPETPEGARDLDMVVPLAPKGVLLPKVDSPEMIDRFCGALDEAGAPRGLEVWAMIETPRGVVEVDAIARIGARRRLAALIVGGNDLVKELRCQRDETRSALTYAMSRILMAGRAFDLTVFDSVYNAFADEDGCAREALQARRMGFDGKTVIHPRQISIVHRAFRPSDGEISFAQKVVEAFHTNPKAGAISIDGEMIEPLHLVQARQTLAMADLIATG